MPTTVPADTVGDHNSLKNNVISNVYNQGVSIPAAAATVAAGRINAYTHGIAADVSVEERGM